MILGLTKRSQMYLESKVYTEFLANRYIKLKDKYEKRRTLNLIFKELHPLIKYRSLRWNKHHEEMYTRYSWAIYKALKNFKPKKGTFENILYRCLQTEGHVFRSKLENLNNKTPVDSLNQLIPGYERDHEKIEKVVSHYQYENKDFENILNLLIEKKVINENQKQLLVYHFYHKLTFEEIGEMKNHKRQGVNFKYQTILKRIRRYAKLDPNFVNWF